MNDSNKTLCLIDGSGYIFRAFYALPPMTRPDGTPVNAVYGFTNMMMNLMQANGCAHRVVIFDAKRQNFRNTIYPDYKANRQDTPPELIPQFSLIRKACEALNVPWLEMEGYEADDLIATYAELATRQDWTVTVISADKDLMQLMTDKVSLYDPMKKKMITSEDVKNKFGVFPDKVIDVQSLMGDSTDNIPGATGIGPKTAAELIQKFGSLENLLQHLDEIPQPKRRDGLIRDKEQILMSRKLVTLDKQVPVDPDLTKFQKKPYNPKILTDFLTQNNFPSLIKKITTDNTTLPNPQQNNQEQQLNTTYKLIQSEDALKKWLQNSQEIALILHQNNKEPSTIQGLALANQEGNTCYIPLIEPLQPIIATDLFGAAEKKQSNNTPISWTILKQLFQDKNILKIGHDIKTTTHTLNKIFKSTEVSPIADIKLMSYTLDGTRHTHSIEELAQSYHLEFTPESTSPKEKLSLSEDQERRVIAGQTDIILRLYHLLSQRLMREDTSKIYQDIDAPLIPILLDMERQGILVDQTSLKNLDRRFTNRLNQLTTQIHAEAKEQFNINSPAQLGVILFEKRGLSGGKRGSNGHWITDVKVLETLSEQGDNLSKLVLQYRATSKLKSTYVEALMERAEKDPRIHTTFSLTATNTGRLASSDPNLQNIPVRTDEGKEIRSVFIAKSGYKILSADYSQIELRLMAEVANVTKLKQSFMQGEDIHARTASQVLHIPLDQVTADQRRRAKAINFGIIYGISPFGLAANLGISRGEAKAYIDTYFQEYPQIKQYMSQTEQFAEKNKFVTTPFGRKIYITGLDNKATKSFALRAAINAPIQGGAADIIKMAMIRVVNALKETSLDATLLLQVHDELVFEVKEQDVFKTTEVVKQAMEQVVQLSIPLVAEVGIGNNWKEAH